jgi:pyrroline-5-carboxylate reductase
MKKTGFIGIGNMGKALVTGLINSGYHPKDILVTDADSAALDEFARLDSKVGICRSNSELVKKSETVVMAVKPQIYPAVIKEIRDDLTSEHLVVTIAAGITLSQMERWLGKPLRVIRTMPNTPAFVEEGMAAYCPNEHATAEDEEAVHDIFSRCGKAVRLPENQMNVFTALSGSSPAWVFIFIEALADGAVRMGLPRDKAYLIASQAVFGSAKMIQVTSKHPGQLKDAVCSPGGTTIEAVAKLEEKGFRSAVMEAVRVCTEKAGGFSR